MVFNAGDYNAYISLKRQISKNLGYLQVGFENVNRSFRMAWSQQSSFGFGVPPGSFNKENIIHLFGSIDQPKLDLTLTANYYLLNNYPYFTNYYIAAQETNPFNVLIISADKRFALIQTSDFTSHGGMFKKWQEVLLLIFRFLLHMVKLVMKGSSDIKIWSWHLD